METKLTKETVNYWRCKTGWQILVVKEFAIKNYGKQVIEMNFILEPEKKEIFSGNITGESVYTKLSIIYRKQFMNKKRILLFLDEI